MNENKTRLQEIASQLAEKMTRAVVDAIEDGAKIEKCVSGTYVDGVYICGSQSDKPAIVLRLDAPEIDELFVPNLQERADRLREELREVENQIKERAKK